MIRAQVIVRPRASIFDPQGDAVCRAIQHLGLSTVKQAHVGKCIELEVDGTDLAKIRPKLETICRDLLSNPVIEDYVLTFSGEKAVASKPAPAKTIKKPATKAKPSKKPVKKAPARAKKVAKPAKKTKKPARPAARKKKR